MPCNNHGPKCNGAECANKNVDNGLMTRLWGPSGWLFLHCVTFGYPFKIDPNNPEHLEKQNDYYRFFYYLGKVLPCKYCRINLTKNLKQKPLEMCHMANRETFSRYIYELHELVNKMLGKKSHLTYCDVRERYEHFRSRCTEERPKIFNFVKVDSKKEKEKGCTEPLYGKKSKCVINIVPKEDKVATFKMDKKCIKTRKKNIN